MSGPRGFAWLQRTPIPTKLEKIEIAGPAGKLEAVLEWDPESRPPLATLVCHPHPAFGGTMHNKVVFNASKAAVHLGLPALRFNFRGVGQSEGEYADGVGEADDARAALDYLVSRFPDTPVCLMGFSFGAWIGLEVGSADSRVVVLVGLGLPVESIDFKFLLDTTKPKLIVQGTRDFYGPQEKVRALFNSLREPKRLQWVEGADHFFTGRLDHVQTAIREFLQDFLASKI